MLLTVARPKIVSSACGPDRVGTAPIYCDGMSRDMALPRRSARTASANGCSRWETRILEELDRRPGDGRDRHHRHNPDHEAGQTRAHRHHLPCGCAPKQIISAIEQPNGDQDPEIRLDHRILELRRKNKG